MRLLIAWLYGALTLGAVTMVYPFLLMLSTSVTSSTDTNEFRLWPRYLTDTDALFAKYVDDKYAGDLERINDLYGAAFSKLDQVRPLADANSAANRRLAALWGDFRATLPLDFQETLFRGYGSHPSQLSLRYREFVRRLFGGDIALLNKVYIEENETFSTVYPPLERPAKRNWAPDTSRKMQDFLEWKAVLPPQVLLVVGAEPLFGKFLREDVAEYGGSAEKAARVWGKPGKPFHFAQVELQETPPADPLQRRDWVRFVRTVLPFRYLALPPEAATPWRSFLSARYKSVAALNAAHNASYSAFGDIPLPRRLPDTGRIVVDWGDFVANAVPERLLRIDTPELRWRKYLKEQEPSLAGARPPYHLEDTLHVLSQAGALRKDYLLRNYRLVIDYILLHGRAVWVTAVFCALAILTTLIVNPMCAYALSRYSLPYAYRVLLFLLATMAFPAEVAMIPNFLLLKQLGLLNTFWALILPGVANGFSIFLLKGFFDSLPRELYEAGTLDGASETRMFRQITLPLSKPIFAVIALQAFTGAYGAFMFAFLVCQDPRMWTIMVWLYELQIANPQYIMMAALAVAAIPTLLVFVFAQNVIMRGIILPSYK